MWDCPFSGCMFELTGKKKFKMPENCLSTTQGEAQCAYFYSELGLYCNKAASPLRGGCFCPGYTQLRPGNIG